MTQQPEPEGTLLGTPSREPQEYSRNIIEYKDPGRHAPTWEFLKTGEGLGFKVQGFGGLGFRGLRVQGFRDTSRGPMHT